MNASLMDSILRGSRYAVAVYFKGHAVRVRLYVASTGRTIIFSRGPVSEGTDGALREAIRRANARGWPFPDHVLAECGVEVAA